MISTKRVAAASFALFFSFLTLIAPAFAAGANQGSSEAVVFTASQLAEFSALADTVYPNEYLSGSSWVWGSVPYAYQRSNSSGYTVYGGRFINNNGSVELYACTASVQVTGTAGGANLTAFNSSTGLYYWQATVNNSSDCSSFPVFSSRDAFLSAVSDFISSSSASALLVEDQETFSFDTDYSVNNTTGVDVAVASYNLGGNDIIVIGCYETVVVPGTIGGLPANYNVNQTLPREQHIPIRYCSLISDTTFSSLNPFDSLEAAVSACYDVLQDSPNHGGGYTPSDVQFTLQPGNVAYIEIADLTEPVILSSSKSSYSALFQTAGSYWPGNQLFKSGMDYPSAGTVLPGATPNQIPWQKNEWGKENLLGQTKQAYAEITASSNLLMIYNPYYQGDDSSTLTNTNLINSAIVISSKGIARNGIRVYNLKDSFSSVDGNYYYGIGSTNPNGYCDYFQSENDPNATNPDVTGWTDENGDPTTSPGVTPYNDPPENDSLADVITGFLSNIGSLFTQGHDAIKSLVESSSEFISRLSSLYAWLPPPVYSVLMSAIILAIIVGVLKVFL